jgi:hypothetical protein
MYLTSIHYWTCKLFIYWHLPQFATTCLITCRGCKRKRPQRYLASPLHQNAFRSFSLTATTRISQHGISSNAKTRCGCYKISTTRNFVSWIFWYYHNTFCFFFAHWMFPLYEHYTYAYIYIYTANRDVFGWKYHPGCERLSKHVISLEMLSRLRKKWTTIFWCSTFIKHLYS